MSRNIRSFLSIPGLVLMTCVTLPLIAHRLHWRLRAVSNAVAMA